MWEGRIFSGASFSNSAPAEGGKGAEEHEGNPLTIVYFGTLVYFGFSKIRGRGRVPE